MEKIRKIPLYSISKNFNSSHNYLNYSTNVNSNPTTSSSSSSSTSTNSQEESIDKSSINSNRKKEEALRVMRDRMLRVDHAGEYGANRIYAGQMAVLSRTKSAPLIEHMWEQEKEHLIIFEKLLPKYRARPTILLPIWNVAGYLLGAGTALLGEKGAMACTVAVESSITEHYNSQIRELMKSNLENKELLEVIQKCRDEEQEHHDTGIQHDAQNAPAYTLLTNVIKTGCKGAIWLSERI